MPYPASARYPYRVLTLLGKSSVIDDPPGASGEVHLRHNPLRNAAQQFFIAPLGFSDKMVRRLMSGVGVQGVDSRCNELDALAR